MRVKDSYDVDKMWLVWQWTNCFAVNRAYEISFWKEQLIVEVDAMNVAIDNLRVIMMMIVTMIMIMVAITTTSKLMFSFFLLVYRTFYSVSALYVYIKWCAFVASNEY